MMAPKINNPFTAKPNPDILNPGDTISLRPGVFGIPSAEIDLFQSINHEQALPSAAIEYDLDSETEPIAQQAQEILALPDVPLSSSDTAVQPTVYESDIDRLVSITEGSRDVLMSVNAVIPVRPYPNSLCVDRQKLTIVHRTFFGSTDTISVQMDDIHNVEAFVGPFFGEIRIFSKYFVNNVQSLPGLKRKDAIAVRRFIQGYMIAHNKGIDCSAIEKNKLIELLTELGKGSR